MWSPYQPSFTIVHSSVLHSLVTSVVPGDLSEDQIQMALVMLAMGLDTPGN